MQTNLKAPFFRIDVVDIAFYIKWISTKNTESARFHRKSGVRLPFGTVAGGREEAAHGAALTMACEGEDDA